MEGNVKGNNVCGQNCKWIQIYMEGNVKGKNVYGGNVNGLKGKWREM